MAVAGPDGGREEAGWNAEHGLRSGPDLLAQVRAVLRCRAAAGPARAAALGPDNRTKRSSAATRTPSWSCRRSASPSPCATSRSKRSQMRSTTLQKAKGLDIPIHVDAASGGFLAPFLTPDLKWDFRLPRVSSINASGHKFGLAPLGVRLGDLARRRGLARRPRLPRQLSRRRHADLRAQLLAAGWSDHRAVLQLPAARPRGLRTDPAGVRGHRGLARRSDRGDGRVHDRVRRQERGSGLHVVARPRGRRP